MRFIKLSVLTRSYDIIYDYNKTGRSFWDDVAAHLGGNYNDAAVERRGNLSCFFYMPANDDADPVSAMIEILKSLGADPLGFVVSSVDMGADDMTKLIENDVGHISEKPWFSWAKESLLSGDAPVSQNGNSREASPAGNTPAASAFVPPAPPSFAVPNDPNVSQPTPPSFAVPNDPNVAQPTPPAASSPEVKNAQSAPQTESLPATPVPPDGKDQPDAIGPVGEDLEGEAARISKLREKLLKVVHGQRHAVDEVVQAIFECDAFNRLNEERRGPLASFIFTGPSGVGKTFLARTCAEALGIKPLVVDMSEFSDNLANNKFNGEHGQPAMVTSYVRSNPKGIIIFDEIEKAHINTIYLFLQILDSGTLTDMKLNKEVSFRDVIIFITTNAGSSLYDDPTVVDLSGVSRRTILEALRTDVKPGTQNEPFFPECITTRFANGHVILFNHLEPYALMEIVKDEIAKQVEYFRKAYKVDIDYDADSLAALVLYSSGGIADARSLRGSAKNMVVKELQDIILQTYQASGKEVNALSRIELTVDPVRSDPEVRALFEGNEAKCVLVFADDFVINGIRPLLSGERTEYEFFSAPDDLKRRARGVVDYVLVDPAAGLRPMEKVPNDLEDIDADGVELFRYLRSYFPEIPVYFLDTRLRGEAAFATLLGNGGRGVVTVDPEKPDELRSRLDVLAYSAMVNNNTFTLGRSGKILNYNCSQYSPEPCRAVVCFDKLSLGYAPSSSDSDVITQADTKNGVTFDEVVGCKEAKKALKDFCTFVADPRKQLMQGKKIPRGILLYGPPGNGKTLLAKAMANEAKAAFIPTTATAFFASLVGESEKNVRDLFRRARRYAPAIIFVDEVDAIARARTGSISTSHNEDTLNEFIAQMDGFMTDERRPVFVIAATNYDVAGEGPRVLDPAFVRRFDRKVFVDFPDSDERMELIDKTLTRHGVDLGEDHAKIIKNLADRSSGMSLADLVTVIDIFMRSCEDNEPSGRELLDALDSFRFGEVNELDPSILRQTACHESGHALVSHLLGETPSFLTVVSRSNFGGYMERARDEKKGSATFGELMDRVCTALAGRAAEMEVYGRDAGLNTGASSDLQNARYVVKTALNEYAMGSKLYTEGTDEDCESLMQEQFKKTSEILRGHRAVLDALTDLLAEKKSLNQAELERFFADSLGD